MNRPLRSLAVGLLVLAGCAAAPAKPSAAAEAPVIEVDPARLASSQTEACARLAALEAPDPARAAAEAGMLPGDFEAFRKVAQERRITVSFRDSNPACEPHLKAGVQSKDHSVLEKTWDASNLKPEHAHYAGLVSTLFKKPPKGEKVDDPQLKLKDGEPITCDYDLMDLFAADGARIRGESAQDLEARAALNAALPPTAKGHRDRVMHGAQAGYGDYLALHPDEPPIAVLFKPEAPLTVLGKDGKVFRLRSVDDAVDLYACMGATRPEHWRLRPRVSSP